MVIQETVVGIIVRLFINQSWSEFVQTADGIENTKVQLSLRPLPFCSREKLNDENVFSKFGSQGGLYLHIMCMERRCGLRNHPGLHTGGVRWADNSEGCQATQNSVETPACCHRAPTLWKVLPSNEKRMKDSLFGEILIFLRDRYCSCYSDLLTNPRSNAGRPWRCQVCPLPSPPVIWSEPYFCQWPSGLCCPGLGVYRKT